MSFHYERALPGGARLTLFTHDSRILRGNPLGDPALRHHPLLLPPGACAGLPLVLVLGGYTSFGHRVLNVDFLRENLPERTARLMAQDRIPPAVFLWPSCETRYGGSQYQNSAGTGHYEDLLRDELVPALEREHGCGGAGRRIVVGKSSGGYGALTLAMRNPGFFAAAGSHSGDMGFEFACFSDLIGALQAWHRHGGPAAFLRALPGLRLDAQEFQAISLLALAAVYSPNPRSPLGFDLPVDPENGALRSDVMERWFAHDPVRMAEDSHNTDALKQLRALYLDAGESDEYGLNWGLRRLSQRLTAAAVPYRAEFFPGGHRDTDHRYEISLPYLLRALA
ncbi:MAG: esterase [Planctomycetota bacterium]|nr:MAG: esterase [Planctomycetota bacterium]